MNTKDKLIDEVKHLTKSGDNPSIDNLIKLYYEYEHKKNTPITHDLLINNGFKYEKVEEDDDCSPYYFYSFEYLTIERIGKDYLITDTDIEIKNVADLEDALKLCEVNKEINEYVACKK